MKRKNSKNRRRLKRRCFKSVLGEDELFLIMSYFVQSMIYSKKNLENTCRDMIYQKLFALSSSKKIFDEAKSLFAKYLFESQNHKFGLFSIHSCPKICYFSYFLFKKNFRICLCMTSGQVISICAFVIRDTDGKYRIHYLEKKEAKQGYIECFKNEQCTAVLNFPNRAAVLNFTYCRQKHKSSRTITNLLW